MNKIKFVGISYWNKETMSLTDSPTPEQWAELDEVVNQLNQKYLTLKGCDIHPDRVQKLMVGLFNNYVDIQIVKSDTCQCQKIVEDLIAIRNYETFMQNPNNFPRQL
jgi:hypothetical protein